MNKQPNIKWHYDTVERFFHTYYDKLLTENMVNGDEMYIEDYKDASGELITLQEFLYPVRKGKIVYLVSSQFIDELPLLVENSEKVSYKGKGFVLVKQATPMKIRPEQKMSFRDLVDKFAEGDHSALPHKFLYSLLVLISFLDRINIRIATPPEFGKDSKIKTLNGMVGNIGIISNPTIAKLEYMLFNKVIFLNEVSNISSNNKNDIEQFLLSCADFSNKYTKRSRATQGGHEDYNISKLSLMVAYNTIHEYNNLSKYFDNLWSNKAISERVLPFLFKGRTKEDFNIKFDVDEAVEDNWSFYLDFIRTLMFYKDYYPKKNYKEYDKHKLMNGRWQRNFNTIKKWVAEYSETEEEYNLLLNQLFETHIKYIDMINQDPDKPILTNEGEPTLFNFEEEMVTEK
jgi:hypothetical protein